jgi:hypothetical protein
MSNVRVTWSARHYSRTRKWGNGWFEKVTRLPGEFNLSDSVMAVIVARWELMVLVMVGDG